VELLLKIGISWLWIWNQEWSILIEVFTIFSYHPEIFWDSSLKEVTSFPIYRSCNDPKCRSCLTESVCFKLIVNWVRNPSLIYVSVTVFINPKYFIQLTLNQRSRDSVVGIETGYGLHDSGVGVRVPVRSRIFSSSQRPDRHWGPLSLLSMGRGALSLGVKRQGCEADHSPPTSVKVKKMWIYTMHSPMRLLGVVLN
jgi:hypothetical protein